MALGDIFSFFTGGGGGGGGGGANALAAFQEWWRDEAVRLNELDAEERARGIQVAGARRGAILDRPGYGGLVNVGGAQQRSDATLAAQMAALGEDDATRVSYEEALAAEAQTGTETLRLTSGEQYVAENELEALRTRLEAIDQPNALMPGADEARSDLETLLEDLATYQERFSFMEDDDGLAEDIQARLEALDEDAALERRRREIAAREEGLG